MVLQNPTEYEKKKTLVFLVRHGDRIHIPNNPNLSLKILGPGLSTLGKKQSREVAKKFSKIKKEIDVLYSSEMIRSIETAREIGEKINKKPLIYEGINEFNKFIWEKKVYHKNFWKNYKLHKISLKKFDEILAKNKEKVIIIVAHGNIIKGIIGNKLGLKMNQIKKFSYDNCAVTLVRFKGKKLERIYYFNNLGNIEISKNI